MSSFGQEVKDKVINELGGTFPELKTRMTIYSDTDKYRWKEEESVWEQAKGKRAVNYEVLFDGEFVAFIEDRDGVQRGYLRVLEGIRELYKEGKIFINKEMYLVKQAQAEEKRKADKIIEIPKAITPEEKMMADVLTRHAKKHKKKVVEK